MSIYLVTWKTPTINGEYLEGSFISKTRIDSAECAINQTHSWKDYVKDTVHGLRGSEVFITGVFKL